MNHHFVDLGWVDFDFGYSARAEEILGEWAEHLVENLNQSLPNTGPRGHDSLCSRVAYPSSMYVH